MDMFSVKNLDFQVEMNVMRPYTYSHNDTVANWSNYNQPLAHPFGANFYRTDWYSAIPAGIQMEYRTEMYLQQTGSGFCGRKFWKQYLLNYNTRPRDYGFYIGSGIPATVVNTYGLSFLPGMENLFLEGTIMYRTYTVKDPEQAPQKPVPQCIPWVFG